MVDVETATQLRTAVAGIAEDLLTPALVVDLDAVDHNISAILRRVRDLRRWRPHIKTLKQSRLVRALLDVGIAQFKCATIDELALALETARSGAPRQPVDVLLAYPVSRPLLRATLALLRAHPTAVVRLVADSPGHLEPLDRWLREARHPRRIDVLLDVDVGMGRTGSASGTWIDASSTFGHFERLSVTGLHGYDGHLTWEEREAAHAGYDRLTELANTLGPALIRRIVTSGSHSFDHALTHRGLAQGPWLHEISPGTLVLDDLRSHRASAALGLRQAAFVATRVVSTPSEDRLTLDAGSKALSPDRPPPNCAVLGRRDLQPGAISEEHLVVHASKGARPARGDLFFLVPDHVCTTVNLYRHVIYVRGAELVGRGSVEAMSRSLMVEDIAG